MNGNSGRTSIPNLLSQRHCNVVIVMFELILIVATSSAPTCLIKRSTVYAVTQTPSSFSARQLIKFSSSLFISSCLITFAQFSQQLLKTNV